TDVRQGGQDRMTAAGQRWDELTRADAKADEAYAQGIDHATTVWTGSAETSIAGATTLSMNTVSPRTRSRPRRSMALSKSVSRNVKRNCGHFAMTRPF